MLPGSTQPARAAVACTGMVAEGPGRGPQRRCASRRPWRKYPRAGHSGRGSGFFCATTHSPIHGAVSCVAIHVMEDLSAPSNVP